MKVIKPICRDEHSFIEIDDSFFDNSHGIISSEFTICGVACDEWGYVNYENVNTIMCCECLEIIKECKSYKG